MKFLSARDFHPLAFLGLTLVVTTAFPTSQVRREDFASDTTPNRPVYTTSQQVENLVRRTLSEILEMRKELCNRNDDCMKTKDALAENNLKLPTIERNDGCLHSEHNREICLWKITSGLLEYQIYLEYVKNNSQDNQKDKAIVIQSNTRALIQIFKQEVKNPGETVSPSPTSKDNLLEELESQKEWSRMKTMQLILKALEDFLMVTMRFARKK